MEKFEYICIGGPLDGKIYSSDRPFFEIMEEKEARSVPGPFNEGMPIAESFKAIHYERIIAATIDGKPRYVFAPSNFKLQDVITHLLDSYKGSASSVIVSFLKSLLPNALWNYKLSSRETIEELIWLAGRHN